MKQTLFFLSFLFLYGNSLLAQDNSIINELKLRVIEQDNMISNLEKKIDSISKFPERIQHSGQISIDGKSEKEKSIYEFFFPSAIALIVGLLALAGTIYTGKKQRESSERQLKEQLIQSQLTVNSQIQSAKETINLQIQSAKDISESQIKTSYDTAQLTFRQNVLSSNRKDWIEKLRNNISILSSKMLMVAFKEKKINADFEDIIHLIGYIELMLNGDDPKDKELIVILRNLPEKVINYPAKTTPEELGEERRELIKKTKVILKSEWERVKKGE